jgi:hypothetical protein
VWLDGEASPATQLAESLLGYRIGSARSRRELLPLLNSKRIELLDLPRLHGQLGGLERRTARGGRDSIDHPPNAHDDLINSAAGALVSAAGLGSADDFNLQTYLKAYGGRGNIYVRRGSSI